MFYNNLLKESFFLSNFQLKQLEKYYFFLKSYSNKINLTSLLSEKEVYLKHFYDSFLVSKIINLIKFEHLCDLGTGAGFPGIPLKILYPHLKVFLLESISKKIIFLKKLVSILNLSNIFIFHHRIEEHKNKYNFIITRSLGKMDVIFKLSSLVIKKKGYLIAMKGPNYIEELKNIKKKFSFHLKKKKKSELPFNLGKRVNLLFQKK
ncbi:16S rRNA (guanine(527)-N(7))-methyltransferase GidB [Candidatus Phytoplasma oryzae]|uniref:Ribosomal RNA small subunit methyltransferase G n=1 Tax=Candidatus Phytoplasma oryzae TaxID=203274 RepID=A0A139JR63_9MOLU|nr:16S rRNA (guanine(527)-N(7))-methyltransferase RsmG [Candidatus Phytoplasma oryzae]KXT29455.1 16S rRNA (guanine(527)-N(7))-methyltransferase GidB [Candidatus Phytoplasma oryzae]RAM58034.1 16S rRNA methyltransferase [Candidatus Phytoplasma oryzae]